MGALVFAVFLAFGASAGACVQEISSTSYRAPPPYSPFDAQDLRGEMSIGLKSLSADEEADCSELRFIVRNASGALRLGSDRVSYTLLDRSGRAIATNGGSVSEDELSAGGGGEQRRISVGIPSRQLVGAGSYADQITLELRDGSTLLDSQDVSLSLSVLPQSYVGVSATEGNYGSAAVLDFGHLEEGERQTAFLSVGSNSPYSLSFESDNNGRLVYAGPSPADGAISYEAQFDGVRLDLSAAAHAAKAAPSSSLLERPHVLVFTIGDTQGNPAGYYRDMVRITVTNIE